MLNKNIIIKQLIISSSFKITIFTYLQVSLLLYTTLDAKAITIEKENQNDENSLNLSS